MLAARAGFLAYPPRFLPKSTIFAAYCAHGLVRYVPGHVPGRSAATKAPAPPFLSAGGGADPRAAAAAAQGWYREHSLARQGEGLLTVCSPGTGEGA